MHHHQRQPVGSKWLACIQSDTLTHEYLFFGADACERGKQLLHSSNPAEDKIALRYCLCGCYNRHAAFRNLQAGGLDVQLQGLAIVCNVYLHRERALRPVSQELSREGRCKGCETPGGRVRVDTQVKELRSESLAGVLKDVSTGEAAKIGPRASQRKHSRLQGVTVDIYRADVRAALNSTFQAERQGISIRVVKADPARENHRRRDARDLPDPTPVSERAQAGMCVVRHFSTAFLGRARPEVRRSVQAL